MHQEISSFRTHTTSVTIVTFCVTLKCIFAIKTGTYRRTKSIRRIKPVNKFIVVISVLVFGKISGISLCPFGIYMANSADVVTLNHGKIHERQQVEMLILPFYLWYLAEFLIRRLSKPRKEAYLSILFEKEA